MNIDSQVGLNDTFIIQSGGNNAFWMDGLIFPFYLTAASATVLLLHIILLSKPVRTLYLHFYPSKLSPAEDLPQENHVLQHGGFFGEAREHISQQGGPIVFAYKIARLIGCLVFFGLCLTTSVLEEQTDSHTNRFDKWDKHERSRSQSPMFSEADWLQITMSISAMYTSLLALISVLAKPRWSGLATKHLVFLLIVLFGVYFYRDLWPLATYTKTPEDISEGWILWAKGIVLGLIAVGIPLLIPRQYVPVDAKDPMIELNPEQTASWLSLLLYTFLDPIILKAYSIPHLSHDQLPPLADYDYAANLSKSSFPYLDPFVTKKSRHLFFGLMKVFRHEYIMLTVMLIVHVIAGFANPVGINQLLLYLETVGEGAIVRPWVWVIWLFIGPVVSSVAFQRYIFIASRTLVRVESILTQLVLEHSLRVRMKAETSTERCRSTTVYTQDGASTPTERSRQGSPSRETSQSSSAIIVSTSSKGKQKARDSRTAEGTIQEGRGSNLLGKINNLVTTDLANITNARDFLFTLVYVPLQTLLSTWFLYHILGWSSFVGLAVMILLFPVPGYITKLIQNTQVQVMRKTDARVEAVTETMNVIRMVKLFGWESKMNKRLAEKREEELAWIFKRQLLDLAIEHVNYVIPIATMLATYATHTVILKQDLSASKVFSSMAVFNMLREQLYIILYSITKSIQGKVSLDRLDDFLRNTELLDEFTQNVDQNAFDLVHSNVQIDRKVIGIRDAVFSWSNETEGSVTPSRRSFNLQIDDEVIFKPGCVNLIVGPTGSGKTSMLMALLGELHFIPSSLNSFVSLPRDGGVAYAAQESWVQNETIRENIIFGSPFDEERYKKVLYQCALERDITLFEAGDRTEVGEKGLTLSGGQKARITLARAVYSPAEILLLDDVLAALDVHTAKWIVDKCFSGDLIHGRTVILVTHNVAMASPVADFVVCIGKDGRILSQGSVTEAIAKDTTLAARVTENQWEIEKNAEKTKIEDDAKQADGKLIVKEEIEECHVSWSALKLYLDSMSRLQGFHPLFFWVTLLGGMFLMDLCNTIQTWYLGYWASQYDHHDTSQVEVSHYLTTYCLILLVSVILYTTAYLTSFYGSIRASRLIHLKLVESVLGTTLRWLDTTPTSRVIARCTQDIAAVDGSISQGLAWLSELSLSMLVKFGAVVVLTPIFIIPGITVGFLGGWCGQIYMKAQLPVKREMSNAKSPVLGHFGAAIAGLTSIRAYGTQLAFKRESMNRIDHYTRAARTFYNLNRWVCIRIDAMGGLFAAGLAAYLVYGRALSTPANTGFSLNQAVSFSSMILWWVIRLNDFEVDGNSLERIQGYVTIEQEPKPTEQGKPPAYWPSSGDLRVENLSAQYSLDGPKVLNDISFHIRSGERVGVVGRTGSGKSSLTLSLLRCIFTDGTVYFDGLPTKSLNLDALRTNITIIPQMPELLSGTLRANLDPFSQYDDMTLNGALGAAGLFSLQSEADNGRITLDSPIASGGGNLSVGQRQILALARAIVRGSKLLILDEATSAIDYKTDSIIQSSLRNRLGSDVTLLTIAHRLQTIMDSDKIMVLDAGRMVEFDEPRVLLQNENSMLRALVNESADKEALSEMVHAKGSRHTLPITHERHPSSVTYLLYE